MQSLLVAAVAGSSIITANAFSIPTYHQRDNSHGDLKSGFNNAIILPSVGGHATCIQGLIPITASAQNYHLNYQGPANQTVATETVVEFLQVNTTLPLQVIGARTTVSGTWNINSKLCFPTSSGAPNASLVQFLTHGVGFDGSYWDFYSADYSYVDNAALNGYTTFSYDRLGTGSSSHPDPIQVVQSPLQVAIAHELITKLRSGAIGSTTFSHVVGVGHSLGSELTNAITAQYPKDLDAAVLTGFSVETTGISSFFSSLDLVPANTKTPSRFSTLPNGYLITNSLAGNQFAFFRFPDFCPDVLSAANTASQTFTIGELFTNSFFVSPAPLFTGPIDVVIGENDLPFCQSNCLVPGNQAEVVRGALYPNANVAGSQVFVLEGAGHGLNLHYNAKEAYEHVFGFLRGNGF
ncbi:hypothetical protein G7Y89_g6085 [Cudoniella acicularis]|uniref:AB hydrolase-1 domain-containing protein n=1 Tax=Cudoniella acicularis TaxID=354080 RepID=A0A8H4RL57_9HELO|nr:hypothetical protein G7Y89_g6085 [Cudoniella acicularis]